MTALVYFKFEHWSTLVFALNLLHRSGLALLEDEQKFRNGGCVGAPKMSISYATCRVYV
jgi:hypothetical protein